MSAWIDHLEARWPALQTHLNQIRVLINEVAIKAPSRDFKDVEANGFRTALLVVTTLGSTLLSTSNGDQVSSTLMAIDWYLKCCLDCDKNPAFEGVKEDFKVIDAHKDVFAQIRCNYKAAHLADELGKKLFKMDIVVQLLATSSWLESLKLATSRRRRMEKMAESMSYTSISEFKAANRWSEQPLLRLATFLQTMQFKDIKRRTAFVNVTSRFLIVVKETAISLIAGDGRPRPPVRTRIYMSRNASPTKLVFHVHGGACVSMSPEAFEPLLLQYARLITNCAIISVDYRLAPEHRFPAGLQDVLDTYLWTSSKECADLLGFNPEQVILIGDSAGGHLVMSLIVVLNDIRRLGLRGHGDNEHDDAIRMPAACLALVPMLDLSLRRVPSFSNAFLNEMFLPSSIFSVINCYYPISEEQTLKQNWFLQDDNADLARILELEKSAYINPLRYEHFHEIQLELQLISATSCPILDQSVELAKKWRGPVHLHVEHRLPHAFGLFDSISATCKRGLENCIITLKRLCDADYSN